MNAPSAQTEINYWVHDLDPVILQLTDTLAIRWYGLAYVTGFLIGFALWSLYRKHGKTSLTSEMRENLALAMILGVVVGGRLGYFLFYEFWNLLEDPLILFRVWTGGMASHGGFLGVTVAGIWFARKYRVSPLHLGDLIASVAAPGLMLGRIANFITGELWGKVTDVPWAVIFPSSAGSGVPVEFISPRHPSQLYEAALEGLFMLIYMQCRFWMVRGRSDQYNPDASRSARPGHLMAEFLIGYSIARWIGEFYRHPDAALIMGLSRGSFYSIFSFLAGTGLLLWIRYRRLTNSESR